MNKTNYTKNIKSFTVPSKNTMAKLNANNLLLISALFLIAVLKLSMNFQIQPKGPTHKKWAVMCIEEIAHNHFNYKKQPGTNENMTYVLLMTILVSLNMTSPAHEIQDGILRKINELTQFPLEVINDHRFEFKSYKWCYNCPTKHTKKYHRHFVEQFKSYTVVMVVDSVELFEKKLAVLVKLKSFDPKANYLVYFARDVMNYKRVAYNILWKFYSKLSLNTLVLIPKNLKIMELYRLEISARSQEHCGKRLKLQEVDRCDSGRMQNLSKYYFIDRISTKYQNCTVDVVSMPYEPFVINSTSGIEIEVLLLLGKQFDIFFNITILRKATDWGEKDENDQWTSGLGMIYNQSIIGIGNIGISAIFMDDFDFTYQYFSESLSWVVPIAQYVPKWRVLTVIFTVRVWSIIIGTVLVFATCFYFTSKTGKELTSFRMFGRSVLSAYQVVIATPVSHPKTDLTRVFFITFALFSLIINAVYTSSLIYFLKNPIREHQIDTTEDILDSDLVIGGLSSYKDMFNQSEDLDEDEDSQNRAIFNRYKIVSEEHDSLDYWLDQVANHGACTLTSNFFIKYQLTQKNNITHGSDDKPKVYVVKQKLLTYNLNIVMKKGFPLLDIFNRKIRHLAGTGLVRKLANTYIYTIAKQEYLQDHPDETAVPLTLDHLQGPFAVVILGFILGTVCLVLEIFVHRRAVRKRREKKTVSRKKFVKRKFAPVKGRKRIKRNPVKVNKLRKNRVIVSINK